MPDLLSHGAPDCRGSWERIVDRNGHGWRCTACDRTHPLTIDTGRAAEWERYLARLAEELTREGQQLLATVAKRP